MYGMHFPPTIKNEKKREKSYLFYVIGSNIVGTYTYLSVFPFLNVFANFNFSEGENFEEKAWSVCFVSLSGVLVLKQKR